MSIKIPLLLRMESVLRLGRNIYLLSDVAAEIQQVLWISLFSVEEEYICFDVTDVW